MTTESNAPAPNVFSSSDEKSVESIVPNEEVDQANEPTPEEPVAVDAEEHETDQIESPVCDTLQARAQEPMSKQPAAMEDDSRADVVSSEEHARDKNESPVCDTMPDDVHGKLVESTRDAVGSSANKEVPREEKPHVPTPDVEGPSKPTQPHTIHVHVNGRTYTTQVQGATTHIYINDQSDAEVMKPLSASWPSIAYARPAYYQVARRPVQQRRPVMTYRPFVSMW
ncbi:Aste57867_2442 [Aphanomyces stellatus]|uniref:Aste57867_2442 protein n=1 Tax=Aphanomyces stellatus TaxID=120398 RepID=A0A485KBA9_9STRA|nr:hypothetical protein As57867_002436 [Aphanomyces stellatus]VFT79643.1 Aste57867_2442 [Aphanomyces stellatus]